MSEIPSVPTSPTTVEVPTVKAVGTSTNVTPLYVFVLLTIAMVGDFVLIGIGKVSWEQGIAIITTVIGIVAALAQPFE